MGVFPQMPVSTGGNLNFAHLIGRLTPVFLLKKRPRWVDEGEGLSNLSSSRLVHMLKTVVQTCVVDTLAALAYHHPHGMVPFLKVSQI